MKREQILLEYMCAHILACNGVRVDAAWTPDEVVQVFHILPKPRVSLPIWFEKRFGKSYAGELQEQEEAKETDYNTKVVSAFDEYFKKMEQAS